MPVTNASFCNWLKGGSNMKLFLDAVVVRITHEGITDFRSFLDFDKESTEALPRECSRSIDAVAEDIPNLIVAEAAVVGANISSIAVRRLVTATNAC